MLINKKKKKKTQQQYMKEMNIRFKGYFNINMRCGLSNEGIFMYKYELNLQWECLYLERQSSYMNTGAKQIFWRH